MLTKYDSKSGLVSQYEIYFIKETPANVSFDFQKLFLNKLGKITPNRSGFYNLSLKINNKEVLNKTINIKELPNIYKITPENTAYGIPTEFRLRTSSNIAKYSWDFGDGTIETTTTNEDIHTYNSSGRYNLTINITDNNDLMGSRTFKINVTSPKKQIELILKEYQTSLEKINNQISMFDDFTKDSIDHYLKLNQLSSNLTKFKLENQAASNEEDYKKLLNDLFSSNIPSSITLTNRGDNFPLYPKKSNINIESLASITNSPYYNENESDYIDLVYNWEINNIKMKNSFRTLKINSHISEYPINSLKVIKLNITKGDSSNSYLIVSGVEDLFSKNNFTKLGNIFYLKLDQGKNQISFSTPDDISSNTPPIFLSPEIDELKIGNNQYKEGNKKLSTSILIMLLAGVLLVGLIVYLVLKKWYKNKYESHLFKNRTNLYNLVVYINNMKKQGIEDKEIIKRLKDAKWSSEQITYVMRKYAGKRTGMP